MVDSLNSSFRDPSGFVFEHQNTIYRQVNKVFAEDFDRFFYSSLYRELVEKEYLLPHEDVTSTDVARTESCCQHPHLSTAHK